MISERVWLVLGTLGAYIFVIIMHLEIHNPIVKLYLSLPLGLSFVGLYGCLTKAMEVSNYFHKTALIFLFVGIWFGILADALYRLGYLPEVSFYLCLGLALVGTIMMCGAAIWEGLKILYLYYHD